MPLLVSHVHDEASMRLRSTSECSHPLVVQRQNRLARARSSKVQNNAVTIFGGGEALEWLVELQPLASKDSLDFLKFSSQM